MANGLLDPRAQRVADRLRAQDRKQAARLLTHFLPRIALHRLTGTRYDRMDEAFFRDKFVALSRDKCELIYILCRSLNARSVVEVGTSFGVSTLYLAAAVRDETEASGHPGRVIATELEPSKVSVALCRAVTNQANGAPANC